MRLAMRFDVSHMRVAGSQERKRPASGAPGASESAPMEQDISRSAGETRNDKEHLGDEPIHPHSRRREQHLDKPMENQDHDDMLVVGQNSRVDGMCSA